MSKEKKPLAAPINIKIDAVNLKIDTPSKGLTTTKKRVVKKTATMNIATEIKKKNSFVEQKQPVSARSNKYTSIQNLSPKSSRVMSTKPKLVTNTISGVKVAKIGLISPKAKRPISAARSALINSAAKTSGFNTARATSRPKSPLRSAKKPVVAKPSPEFLEPLKAHNLELALENAYLNHSTPSS